MVRKISMAIAFLTGLGLIFIGARFLITPEVAEISYGLRFNEHGDYSFHYIKGIRDMLPGLLICIFAILKQTKALAITLLAGTMVPVVDMLIVGSKGYNGISALIPHICAIIVCALFGLILLLHKPKITSRKPGYIKLTSSASANSESVLVMNIQPGEKTPWHYHTLFSETFEILGGTLEVGIGTDIFQLKQGDMATIHPKEKHYFNNISKADCRIRTSLYPGNEDFENSLLISKGLAKDNLASISGVPRKISDLALFIHLNNSKMVGWQRMAEPVFGYLAKMAIKRGRLEELKNRYCT